MTLTLDVARTILRDVIDRGEKAGMNPISVCVVDAGGYTIVFERADGASPLRYAVAHGKANGAVQIGVGSRGLFERAKTQPWFIQSMTALAGGALVPVPGGVLIKSEGRVIGAVGVTGDSSDNDEAVAAAAIEAAGYEAVTGG